MPAALTAQGLRKSFGGIRVIDGLDLTVEAGETLGILGPNGAGKTTLFNLISGDLRADDGRIALGDADITSLPAHRRCRLGIGRSYQIPRPFSGMTVYENLLVAAAFGAGMSERAAYGHCAEVIELVGLAPKANVLAGALTLLDRKRLELARALAARPRVLLLDEIAGGLTDLEAQALVKLIRSLRTPELAIVWIEHVVHAIVAAADRLLVMNFGARLAEGKPAEVMADPEVQRVYMGIEA
jgi:branched-chain amino acid transport system ATP-binding protein